MQIEHIICAAIKYKDAIIRWPHHWACYETLFKILPKNLIEKQESIAANQWFITSRNKFVDREKGAKIAYRAGQTKKLEILLMSEDLDRDLNN